MADALRSQLERAQRQIAKLERETEALRRGHEQGRLFYALPLPPEVDALILAVLRLLQAEDACDREAERPRESQSSAPVVRRLEAMADVREAAAAIPRRQPGGAHG